MTPEDLIAIRAEHIHWNPGYNGGFHEYYLPITGDGRGPRDGRLSVRFGEHRDHPVRVWLIAGSGMIPLDGIHDVDDFLTMYKFVTGKWRAKRIRQSPAAGALDKEVAGGHVEALGAEVGDQLGD